MKNRELVHFAVAGNDRRGHLSAALGAIAMAAGFGLLLGAVAFIAWVL